MEVSRLESQIRESNSSQIRVKFESNAGVKFEQLLSKVYKKYTQVSFNIVFGLNKLLLSLTRMFFVIII